MSLSDITVGFVNYYEELSLSSEFTTAEIREKLEEQRYQWQARASRAGSQSERAQKKLEIIAEAEKVFASDDTREQYDLELIRYRQGHTESAEVEIDWLGRAWSYYFMDDEGAAFVAARKAREQDSQSPLSFVVSAWIALKQKELRQAKGFADEAFVLDELGTDTTDVHHVRGVVFYNSDDYEKALASFDRALKTTQGVEATEITWRKIRVHIAAKNYHDGVQILEGALAHHNELSSESRKEFFASCAQIASLYAGENLNQESLKRYDSLISAAEQFDIDPETKRSFVAELKAQIKSPAHERPGFPLKSLGIGVVMFLIFLASGSGIIFLISAAILGFAGYVIYSRSQWVSAQQAFEAAVERIKELDSEIRRVTSVMQMINAGNKLAA